VRQAGRARREQLPNHQKPWWCNQIPTRSIGPITAPRIWSLITVAEGVFGGVDPTVVVRRGLGMAAGSDGKALKKPPGRGRRALAEVRPDQPRPI